MGEGRGGADLQWLSGELGEVRLNLLERLALGLRHRDVREVEVARGDAREQPERAPRGENLHGRVVSVSEGLSG